MVPGDFCWETREQNPPHKATLSLAGDITASRTGWCSPLGAGGPRWATKSQHTSIRCPGRRTHGLGRGPHCTACGPPAGGSSQALGLDAGATWSPRPQTWGLRLQRARNSCLSRDANTRRAGVHLWLPLLFCLNSDQTLIQVLPGQYFKGINIQISGLCVRRSLSLRVGLTQFLGGVREKTGVPGEEDVQPPEA